MAEFASLLPPSWQTKVTEWIHEDIPSFDYGGFVVGNQPEKAVLWGKTKAREFSPVALKILLDPFSFWNLLDDRECWLESPLSTRSFAS